MKIFQIGRDDAMPTVCCNFPGTCAKLNVLIVLAFCEFSLSLIVLWLLLGLDS